MYDAISRWYEVAGT